MDVRETRLANIESLAAQHRYAKEFCKTVGLDPSYLSQLRSRSKSVGNALARAIEGKLGLEAGWLDVPQAPQAVDTPRQAGAAAPTPPNEVMSAAYALQTLDPRMRDSITRLILTAAQVQLDRRASNETPVPTFEFTYDPEHGESSGIPEAAARQRRAG